MSSSSQDLVIFGRILKNSQRANILEVLDREQAAQLSAAEQEKNVLELEYDDGSSHIYHLTEKGKHMLNNLCDDGSSRQRSELSRMVEDTCEGLYTKKQIRNMHLVDKVISPSFLEVLKNAPAKVKGNGVYHFLWITFAVDDELMEIDERYNSYQKFLDELDEKRERVERVASDSRAIENTLGIMNNCE